MSSGSGQLYLAQYSSLQSAWSLATRRSAQLSPHVVGDLNDSHRVLLSRLLEGTYGRKQKNVSRIENFVIICSSSFYSLDITLAHEVGEDLVQQCMETSPTVSFDKRSFIFRASSFGGLPRCSECCYTPQVMFMFKGFVRQGSPVPLNIRNRSCTLVRCSSPVHTSI